MLTLMAYHIRAMLRNRSILIWSLAFPLILSTCFSVMFQGFTSNMRSQGIELGVVADARYEKAAGLRNMLEGLADGGDALFVLTEYGDAAAADDAVLAGSVSAYVAVDAEGMPSLHVSPAASGATAQSIVRAVLDRYVQGVSAAEMLANGEVPYGSGAAVGDQSSVATTELDILRVAPSEFARYYYTVLAYTCIVGGNVAVILVTRVRTNDTEEGLRCQIAAARPAKQLGAAFCAAWLINFFCLLTAFAYMRFVLDVSFGGREALVPLVCAVGACVSCAFGALVGALPGLTLDSKETVISVGTLVLCLPAGLFGSPAMELANWLTLNAPWAQAVNPATQVTEAFYALVYHDSLVPLSVSLGTLLAIAAALMLVAALFMRRQRYAYL